VAAQDPGGASAVAPVAQRLVEEGQVGLKAAGARWAARTFWSYSLPVLAIAELEQLPATWEAADDAARKLLAAYPADGLLLGTSWGPSLEKSLTRLAARAGIPTLAVLDAWANYAERFYGPRPADGLVCLPDRVAVMDDWARRDMGALGFPEERLVVTGHPAFDEMVLLREPAALACRRAEARRSLGLPADATVVAFFSQAITTLYGDDPRSPSYLGYDERTVMPDIVAAVEALRSEHSAPLVLAVKLHPKDDAAAVRGALTGTRGAVVILPDADARALLFAADVAVGMSSTLLVESYLLGKPTISYQPGLRREDPLILTRAGALPRWDNGRDLLIQLRLVLGGTWGPPPPPAWWQPLGGATARVAVEVYRMLGPRSPVIGSVG